MWILGEFGEKSVIVENVDFLMIFVFIQEESSLDYGLGFELWNV